MSLETIVNARYLSAAAVAILFYDRCIHLDEEVEDIWSGLRKKTWLKMMFLCGRCTSEIAVLLSGFSTHLNCKTVIIIVVIFLQVSVIGTEGVVVYRLRLLWDRSRYATYAIGIMASFVVTMTITATVLQLSRLPGFPSAANFPQSHQCLFMVDSKRATSLILVASALVVWDASTIFIFVTNTFATPYQCSQDVFSRFKRDGGRYFICLFVVRFMSLFMTVFDKGTLFFAVPFTWALATVINARVFHRIGRDLEVWGK